MSKRSWISFLVMVAVALLYLWSVSSANGDSDEGVRVGVDDDALVALRTPPRPTSHAITRAPAATPTPTPAPTHPTTTLATTEKVATSAPTFPEGTSLPEHNDANRNECDPVAGRDRVLGDFRREVRVVCEDKPTGIRVLEYVSRSFEYKPQIFLFENVDVEYFNGDFLPNPCPVGSYFEEERSNDIQKWAQGEKGRELYNTRKVRHITDRTFVRVKRFDVYNIYEAFHAYFNAYLMIQVLRVNQTQVQFVMMDTRQGDSPKDALWWNSMNRNAFPIIYTNNHGQHNVGMVDGVPYRARLVRSSSSGTSILTSKRPPLLGRSRDHHCKSSLFRSGVAWLRDNFGSNVTWSHIRPLPKTVVVWSSRRPYQRDFHYNHVPRQLPREDEFITALQADLGDKYEVRNVDFGALNPDKSIEEASNADVIVGVHGAGLTWASFLPRHGGLVELFGGDRGSNNRHYHNLASLADIHYRSMTLGSFNWNAGVVSSIKQQITSIPLHQASSEP
ncbi:membrane-associated protein, putative [Bodo saltans]|uniref:Membrane-associated protein, putative n=1 Tax=Bodo saltans TaxID=75058 RepID=A0A0S4KHP7_BODSA|nr:membrane-associated protein, putative [Bodo saltans]|eukprot:CUI12345.1 membrane-associated protein, putative [Bodo saltans]